MQSLRNTLARIAHDTARRVRRLHPLTSWNDGCCRVASSQGQGTVEYVGIVLVVGALLLALKSGLGTDVGTKVGSKITAAVVQAIGTVMDGKS